VNIESDLKIHFQSGQDHSIIWNRYGVSLIYLVNRLIHDLPLVSHIPRKKYILGINVKKITTDVLIVTDIVKNLITLPSAISCYKCLHFLNNQILRIPRLIRSSGRKAQ